MRNRHLVRLYLRKNRERQSKGEGKAWLFFIPAQAGPELSQKLLKMFSIVACRRLKIAPAIKTFLASVTDFKGKKVVLFVTTSSRIKQSAFDEYAESIRKKGGEVIGSFFIKTLWGETDEIKAEAKEIIMKNKEKWMMGVGEKGII